MFKNKESRPPFSVSACFQWTWILIPFLRVVHWWHQPLWGFFVADTGLEPALGNLTTFRSWGLGHHPALRSQPFFPTLRFGWVVISVYFLSNNLLGIPVKKSQTTGSLCYLALFPRDWRFIEPHPVSTHEIVFYVDIRMSSPIPYQV